MIALVFAGGPFWLTGLQITLAYPASRFTLPFMLGVSLLLAGALQLLPLRVQAEREGRALDAFYR